MMQYFQNQYPAICEKLEKDNFLDPDATYIQHPDIYSKVVYIIILRSNIRDYYGGD